MFKQAQFLIYNLCMMHILQGRIAGTTDQTEHGCR